MELALFSALIVVIITQLFRQLLPNLFTFVWQAGISNAIPSKHLEYFWFTDKDSLFYKKQGEVAITKYPLFSQPNLRSMALLFGIVFIVIYQLPINDIKENWQPFRSLAGIVITIFVATKMVVDYIKNRFNPDVILWGFFNFMSFVVSFDFIVKNVL